jgi:hypothetical protein
MIAQDGARWFARPTDSRWPSLAVSIVVSASLFTAAVASMRSISAWTGMTVRDPEPVMIRLPALTMPRPRALQPTVRRPNEPTQPSRTIPRDPARSADALPVATVPVAPPADSAVAPRALPTVDSAAVGKREDLAKAASAARRFVIEPVAVTHRSPGARLSREDSILSERFTPHVAWDWWGPPTEAERAQVRESQLLAERMALRATSAGNANEVHTMTGEGRGGVGAVGGGKAGVSSSEGRPMLSIPFPLFSRGPSAAQRRRDAQINADNQLRLERLQARVRAIRDSIHADSVHRDSLARRPKPLIE